MCVDILLLPLECVYRTGWTLWNWGYCRKVFPIDSVGAKVISIGNLTWGGTGKTPLVEYLARRFKGDGKRVAVLSRGYGSPRNRLKADEVQWLTHKLEGISIFSDPDRVASARQAQQQEMEVLILDDGFQHRRLARRLDIVTMDATDPFGNGHLIPAGKLREPLKSLRRANWIILTKTDLVNDKELSGIKEKIEKIVPGIPISETIYHPVGLIPVILSEAPTALVCQTPNVSLWRTKAMGESKPVGAESKNLSLDPSTHSPSTSSGSFAQDDKTKNLDLLRGKPVGLAAAIGNPEGFKRTVEKLGAQVKQTYFKRDHSHYSSADFQRMEEIQKKNSLSCWVTTSKDTIKIRQEIGQTLGPAPTVYELEIELLFKEGERELWQAIESL